MMVNYTKEAHEVMNKAEDTSGTLETSLFICVALMVVSFVAFSIYTFIFCKGLCRFVFISEILSLSITGRIFGHFTGRVHELGCGLEGFLGLDFIITSEHYEINNIIYLHF